MIVILLLIPLSIVIAVCFLTAFIWAVRSGQYEDTCTPAMRLLMEEKEFSTPDSNGRTLISDDKSIARTADVLVGATTDALPQNFPIRVHPCPSVIDKSESK